MSYVAKILVVDDEPRMCDSLKLFLGNEGYEIQTRHSGREALEALAKDDYDLVLLDLLLPDIGTAEIMDHINSRTPDTFVIVFTGHASSESAVASLKKGAFDYLRKPFEYEELLKTVKNALDQKALKTDRKRAEEALVRAKEDWEKTFDAITDMVMLLDNKHRIIRVNSSAAKALNATKESLVGKKCYEAVHGQKRRIGQCPLTLTIKTLKPQTKEITEAKLGGTFICSTSPILDHPGQLRGYAHTLKDVTQSKRLEAQLQQAQKLEAIGTLAGGIAHDFNNVLMSIRGHASLALVYAEAGRPHSEHLKGIEDSVQRGAELTKQLLGFAKGGKYEVKPTDLNELIESSSEMFGRTKKEIRIHRKYQKGIWPVEVDQGQVEQVLLNLYVNAWQAMPGGGDLYLQTTNVAFEENHAKPFGVGPGRYVKISVTDTGVGMDEATQQRIFDPFFTTKEMGLGTGLGLASAYGIIKSHHGIISVNSEKGNGTTFHIHLPASEKEVKTRVKGPDEEMLKGTETVLLVDDEDMILDVGKGMLAEMGYKVLLARGGKEALRVYKKHKDKIDLVILDMIMPDISGGEIYDKMKEDNPKVKALLASGYSVTGHAADILKRGCDGFIQKPFDMKQLSGKIRHVLGKK
jgi:two-component system cell cycle sensor histidine kinase/response regulator CckA